MSLLSPGLPWDQGKQKPRFHEMPTSALLAELILHLRYEGFLSLLCAIQILDE